MSAIEKLRPKEDLSFEKILNNMLDGTSNLDLKTHVFKPKQLASLVIFSDFIKEFKVKIGSAMLEKFTTKYLRLMISYNRESRKEVIKALSEPREEMKTEKSKYTKKLNK